MSDKNTFVDPIKEIISNVPQDNVTVLSNDEVGEAFFKLNQKIKKIHQDVVNAERRTSLEARNIILK